MRNDNFGIKNQTSEQVGQFGNNKANVGHLNAFEAVIALTFGGVNETEVTIGGGTEGHVATGNECRAVTKTWEAIDTTSVLLSTANGSGLPEVSHEARAVWLMANWVKYGYAPKLFGASVDTIKVVQADPADTNSCLRYCNASFTGETDTITKLYNLWANTDAGRRHFLSSIGTILSTDIVVRGQTLGKMLGGEKSFTKDMLEKVLQAGDNFEMADLTGALRTAGQVTRNMSVEKLEDAWNTGYTTLAHLGITQPVGSAHKDVATVYTGDAEVVAATDFGIFTRTATSPAIADIINSPYRTLFLKTMLRNEDGTDVHKSALSTAIMLVQHQTGEKQIKVVNTKDKESGSVLYQAMPLALALLNEVRKAYGKEAYPDFVVHSAGTRNAGVGYLQDSDRDGRQIPDGMLNLLATSLIYATVDSDSLKDKTVSVYEDLVYTKYEDEFDVNENGTLDGKLTSNNLKVNKYFKTNHRDVTQGIVAKQLLQNFKLSPGTFIEEVLPVSLDHMEESYVGLNGITGQQQANIYAAFGPTDGSSTAWGRVFSGHGIPNLQSKNTGFVHEKAQVYMFMVSLLTRPELDALLLTTEGQDSNGLQLSKLLKYTKATTTPVAASKVEFKNGDATTVIRFGTKATSWNTAPLTQGDIFDTSGDMRNKGLGGKNGTAATITDPVKKTIIGSLVDQINLNLFFSLTNQAIEKCRLQLINGVQISAVKIQEIAGEGETDIEKYDGSSAINVTESNDLNTIITNNKKKLASGAFVKAAFLSLAKGQGYYEKITTAQTAKTERDATFIQGIHDVLDGSSAAQQKEFFWITALMADAGVKTAPEDASYINLAKSVYVMIAEELQDDSTSDVYHVSDGWKNNNELLTDKDNRAPLAKALTITLGLGIISKSTPTKINSLTMTSEAVTTDYDDQHAALACDKKLLRLGQIASGVIDKGSKFDLYDFRKEVSPTDSVEVLFKKAVMMYMAAFLNEKPENQYALYDTDTLCAGLGQESLAALMTDGAITEDEIRSIKHGVEVDEEGTSKTNHKTHAESHTFFAIDHGEISECTGFDANGNATYSPLKVNDYLPRT
jgi:hypothetical protein